MIISIKYIDPNTNNEIIEELDDSAINIPNYVKNLHKNYLCKDYCDGQNCRIWMYLNNNWALMGVED